MGDAPKFAVGDRVKIATSDGPLKDRIIGKTGVVYGTTVDHGGDWADHGGDWAYVRFDTPVYTKAGFQNYEGHWALFDELEAVQ